MEHNQHKIKRPLIVKQTRNKETIEYVNKAIAFDTETTSFIYNGNKIAWVYLWTLAIDDDVVIGRSLSEFAEWIEEMRIKYKLNENRRIIVYVHNLPFDFSFLPGSFRITDVFAVDNNKPVKCVLNGVCELKCSYILTNKSLDTIAKEIGMKKLKGDLDYNLIRTSETVLTDKELKYAIEDVRILRKFIDLKIEEENNKITNIPLTKTGYVRRTMRRACHSKEMYKDYIMLMNYLTLSPEEYIICKRAFMGGFTHANFKYVGKILENVGCNDFTSSYPSVICCEKFPMSKGFKVQIGSQEEFMRLSKDYALIFDAHIDGISLKEGIPDCPISISKCFNKTAFVDNNGRLFQAESIDITCTDVDMKLYMTAYNMDYVTITNAYAYYKDYLPKPIVETTLKLYAEKTKLKNVIGYESEYARKKEDVNSIYGMMVTDIIKDGFLYDDNYIDSETNSHWKIQGKILEEQVRAYNESKNRFTFYPWGIFITAYARFNLWKMILIEGNDYVYSDTDSTKMLNKEKYVKEFEKYNREIDEKMKRMCEFHKFPLDIYKPKDIEGIEHPLGYFDDEKPYKKFKTLGAKRYMYEYKNGEQAITIAGLNKIEGLKFMKKDNKDPFELFQNEMSIPPDSTGKMCHTYITKEYELDVTDYLGKTSHVHTYGGCHLEPTPFTMGLTDNFIRFLSEHTIEV